MDPITVALIVKIVAVIFAVGVVATVISLGVIYGTKKSTPDETPVAETSFNQSVITKPTPATAPKPTPAAIKAAADAKVASDTAAAKALSDTKAAADAKALSDAAKAKALSDAAAAKVASDAAAAAKAKADRESSEKALSDAAEAKALSDEAASKAAKALSDAAAAKVASDAAAAAKVESDAAARKTASDLEAKKINCKGSWSGWEGKCRTAYQNDDDGTFCGGAGKEKQYYYIEQQAQYGGAECEATEQQTRERDCKTAPCKPVNCEASWITIENNCGNPLGRLWGSMDITQQYKITKPSKYNGKACEAPDGDIRHVACPPINCVGAWSNVGECETIQVPNKGKLTYKNLQTQKYTITTKPSGVGLQCEVAEGATRQIACTLPEATDCEGYSDQNFGECSKPCGGGTQTKKYHVTKSATHGGNIDTCPFDDGQVVAEQACNTQECDITNEYPGPFLCTGWDNLMYTKATVNGIWAEVPNSGDVYSVIQLKNGSFVGIGTNNKLYSKLTLTEPWNEIDNTCCVMSFIQLQDGSFVGVGGDNLMYTKKALTLTAPWVQIPNSGSVKNIIQLKDGSILGIGTDNGWYIRNIAYDTASWDDKIGDYFKNWFWVIKGGEQYGHGKDYWMGQSTDYVKANFFNAPLVGAFNIQGQKISDWCVSNGWTEYLNSVYAGKNTLTLNWIPVPNSGYYNSSVTQLSNGTFIGVATDSTLYTKKTLTSPWSPQVANSGSVRNITVYNPSKIPIAPRERYYVQTNTRYDNPNVRDYQDIPFSDCFDYCTNIPDDKCGGFVADSERGRGCWFKGIDLVSGANSIPDSRYHTYTYNNPNWWF